jgi:ABC-type Fe3+/spermidine/putrescine transport system ATPase subunit
MTPVLALEGVTVLQHGRAVLDEVSVALAPGEILALVGPSGSGKTTLLRVVLGLLAPGRGTVRLQGRAVSRDGRVELPPEARNVAMVFQDLALWPHLTVSENLAFGLRARGVAREQRAARIATALQWVGLEDYAQRRPGSLSGGERQRVAIARALVLEPVAVLFDEPLSNLDVVLRREILDLIRDLLRERGCPAIFVTHDPREAAHLASRLVVLEQGRVTQSGAPDTIRAAPASEFARIFSAQMHARKVS